MRTEDIVAVARRYAQRFPGEAPTIAALLALAESGADLTSRREFRGHVTCGAIVFTPEGKLLMVHHRSLDRWLFPGGHVEDRDISLRHAALRELAEETGLTTAAFADFGMWLDDMPLHIDCHPIPANPRKQEPEHWHWDFRYAFRGSAELTAAPSDELIRCDWVDLAQTPIAIQDRLRELRLL